MMVVMQAVEVLTSSEGGNRADAGSWGEEYIRAGDSGGGIDGGDENY